MGHKSSVGRNRGVPLSLESCLHERRKLASLGLCIKLLIARYISPLPHFVSIGLFVAGSHYVALAALELSILLLQASQCQDCSCMLLYLLPSLFWQRRNLRLREPRSLLIASCTAAKGRAGT